MNKFILIMLLVAKPQICLGAEPKTVLPSAPPALLRRIPMELRFYEGEYEITMQAYYEKLKLKDLSKLNQVNGMDVSELEYQTAWRVFEARLDHKMTELAKIKQEFEKLKRRVSPAQLH